MSPHPYDAGSIEEITITELQTAMQHGHLTAQYLVELYLERIQKLNPLLNAVIEINPDALNIARQLDQERAHKGPRGLLLGIAGFASATRCLHCQPVACGRGNYPGESEP